MQTIAVVSKRRHVRHSVDGVRTPNILVIGQSHTTALSHHLRQHPDENIVVLNFNEVGRMLSDENRTLLKGEFHPSLLDGYQPKFVVSMIGGNYHNVFGLIENPVKFDFMASDTTISEVDEGRFCIPYRQVYDYFEDRMRNGFLKTLLAIRDVANAPIYHVCSPPPNPNNEFIVRNPGSYFAERVKLGVAPARLRKQLYDIHSDIFSIYCAENGISFVPPPLAALDENGFLKQPYWQKDPTHANAAYGGLVIEQLRALVSA